MTPTPNDTLSLLSTLIRYPSITPNDAGCQDFIANFLSTLGFEITHLRFGDVSNLWAKRGTNSPLFVFVGHTDVVPTGPLEQWEYPPFEAVIQAGILYGRGAADMKGSIAAMMIACAQFIETYPEHAGSIAFLITSDEEGPAIDGTCKVVDYLKQQGEEITWCLVGEPSSQHEVGDTLKIGRRGSLNAKIIIHGKQGHIAYPHLAQNPIPLAMPALLSLCQKTWDHGHDIFPPTSFQISNIHAGTGATNVIPGSLEIHGNFRYSPKVTADALKMQVIDILQQHGLTYDIHWTHSAQPFLSAPGQLLAATQTAIKKITGRTPELSTSGGTSDARFMAPLGCEVLELGPCNASIHQINEQINIVDLRDLTRIYREILFALFGNSRHPAEFL